MNTSLTKSQKDNLPEIPKPQSLLDSYVHSYKDINIGDYFLKHDFNYEIIQVIDIDDHDEDNVMIQYTSARDFSFSDNKLVLEFEDWKHRDSLVEECVI